MEELIKLETALLAKEKGFTDSVIDYWEKRKDNWEEEYPPSYDFGYGNYNKNDYQLSRPSQSSLQSWLREKRIDITVITDWKNGNRVYYVGFSFVNDKNEIDILFSKDEDKNKIEYSDYEEALEFGLFECLQRVSETVA